jgi:PAS domain S-box-containing protein
MRDETRLILVVEDDPGTATLQRRRLERAGFTVEVAEDVDAAIGVLGRLDVDLVVIDYRLGTTTGLDLNRRIKTAGFDVPVIIVSAALSDEAVIEAMRAGVRDVLVKNLDYLDQLPDAVRGVLNQAAAAHDLRKEEHHGTRVLIVEDDAGIATLEKRQLERSGYEVVVAGSPAEALRAVRNDSINLALLDLRLEEASGLDLYEQLKAEGHNIPAILVTAFPDQTTAIRALRAGVRDFVPKSAEFLEYLPTAVDRVVGQVRVERKLVESELRLASIIGTAMDAIVMCDDHLRIILFNRSAERMFGLPASQALHESLHRFIPDIDLFAPRTDGCDTADTVQGRLEVNAIRADGERFPVEVSISEVAVHARCLYTVIARDITERKRAEAELREADHRKDVFLGMLGHELRNPLAAITTAGEVLHRTIGDPAGHKLTNVIRRQTAALARMVDDLLDVSRVTLGKIQLTLEPLLLSEVARRAADHARAVAAKGDLRVDVEIGPEPVWIDGDATRLDQVLANLLNNAAKFTPPGGTIALTAGVEGTEAVIRVRDSGIGIEPALLPRIFDLFVQGDTSLDRAKSGLGIGLALVRQVVTMHRGRVVAHSAGSGRGSEFVVTLPVLPFEGAVVEEPESTPAAERHALSILVVDDHPDLADAIASLLEGIGHEARAVYSGEEALATARTRKPDVMIVDIGMPGMTGYDVARRVRADRAFAGTRLVALTGYGRDEDRVRVIEAGFDLHLTKPVSESQFQKVLSSLSSSGLRQ